MINFLLLVQNKFNKFNNTGAQMLDSIYQMTLIKNHIFGVKTSRFCHLLHNLIMDVMFTENLETTSGLSILLHSIISLSGAMSCDKSV